MVELILPRLFAAIKIWMQTFEGIREAKALIQGWCAVHGKC